MAHIKSKPFICITSKYEVLKVGYDRVANMRLVWTCSDLDVFVSGPLPSPLYEQAGKLALHECASRHIPAMSLRSVRRHNINPGIDTKTRRMF